MGRADPRGRGHNNAFTLVEITVAGAAISLALAAGAVCAGGVRGADEIAGCQSNLRTIGAAAAQYSADHRGWIVGSPGTSGRELLNDPRAIASGYQLEVDGDATQPFDWAGPLAWNYFAPDATRPDRRDERFALLNGTPIPDYTNPNFDPSNVDTTRNPGSLGVFADPAQVVISIPYVEGGVVPGGISTTALRPQLAVSYTTAISFLYWNSGGSRPRWAGSGYWGGIGTTLPSGAAVQPPGYEGGGGRSGLQPTFRPYLDRVGNPAAKIFMADGMRYQSANLLFAEHDVTASAKYGGAFSDPGAYAVSFTRAWPLGFNAAGQDMTGNAFRHGAAPDHQGNALFFDGSVRLLHIAEARRPEHWLPRGTWLDPALIWSEIRDEYPLDRPGAGMFNLGARVRIP